MKHIIYEEPYIRYLRNKIKRDKINKIPINKIKRIEFLLKKELTRTKSKSS